MRAVRCCDNQIQVVDVLAPRSGGVRVKVRSASICGSDLHLIAMGLPLPNTLGHEFAGVLDDGRAVAIEPLVPCGTCDLCAEGRPNLCRDGTGIIMGIGRDGGMTDEIWVPERCLVPLAKQVAVENACLVEPIAVAVHGIREGGVVAGDRVAVIGAGSIGLCALVAAQAAGAEVAVVARHKHQVEAAERLGGVALEGEYPVVIDCAGTAEALEQAVQLCRPGGTLILLASYWHGMTLPGIALCLKEVRIVPSSLYAHRHDSSDFELAAQILADQPEVADTLITHRLPLDEAGRAFELAADRQSGVIKVALDV
ncbi:MAG: alcohol dehydrogenase catalytic domain-containing protein [Deltaproteobacteria bacterium]|nr:alcohol dehydrogenase catalytic domain-containing protein [Deltaproteobacteria bacterium]MBW2725265.1 alcohol dehydrogenase catalytic domain-containing protein [Deltaproteobacteria bacterium]